MGVLLAARQQLREDVSLTVGGVQQEVKVSGDTVSTIETESNTISAVLNSADVQNLPISSRAGSAGTSTLNLIGTLPGVQSDPGGFSAQGSLPYQSEVVVDGVTIMNATGGGAIADAFPSSEALSELRADGVGIMPSTVSPARSRRSPRAAQTRFTGLHSGTPRTPPSTRSPLVLLQSHIKLATPSVEASVVPYFFPISTMATIRRSSLPITRVTAYRARHPASTRFPRRR